MSGHASGQLCRLRLTVPIAPGADPSQVGALRFRRPPRIFSPYMHCSMDELEIAEEQSASSLHAPVSLLARPTTHTGGWLTALALRTWLTMQVRSACGQVELAGGDDFAGTHLVPWLTLHAGPVADLALNADTHEAWALYPLIHSSDRTCSSHYCLVRWHLHVGSGGNAGRLSVW